MRVIVAKHAGFCFGVKRAIDIAKDVASRNNEKTYVYGQLVHNEKVINDLEREGLLFVDDIDKIPNGASTVLRAHGEPGSTYVKLEKRGIKDKKLNDATCPLVTLVHNVAIKLKSNGYEVILFGKPDHPESIGTSYYLNGENTFFIWDSEDYERLVSYIKGNSFEKIAIIAQTTMSVDGYRRLIENLNNKDLEFKEIPLKMEDFEAKYGYVDTICQPTKQRQLDTEEVCRKADVMIVIGGKNSSNTKELVAKCQDLGVETYFIQSEEQVRKEWFEGREIIGVSAGASTPDELINGVVDRIREMSNEKNLNYEDIAIDIN